MPEACDHRPVASKFFQIQGSDPHGGDNCTAAAAAAAAAYDSCGAVNLTAKQIRAASTEPEPDPVSPGLNLVQVRDAIRKLSDGAVELTIFTGAAALDWDEYEKRRRAGHAFITQINYTPITESPFVADPGFKRGHAILETPESTYDPLADGRRPGIFKHDGRLYPRDLIKEAAGEMVTRKGPPVRKVGFGKVWCAMTRDRRSGVQHAPVDFGRNRMLVTEGITVSSSHVMALKKNTPLRRTNQPGSAIVTRMSRDADVGYFGRAGNGMAAVLVRTRAFEDGVLRPVILYVNADAGKVTAR
jgi:hypothetical protein